MRRLSHPHRLADATQRRGYVECNARTFADRIRPDDGDDAQNDHTKGETPVAENAPAARRQTYFRNPFLFGTCMHVVFAQIHT